MGGSCSPAARWVWIDASHPIGRAPTSGVASCPALARGYAPRYGRIYEQTNFWTSSPTFFFLRAGVLISVVPIAYAWNALFKGRSPLREFGMASLFVYWIHVEMVYGVVSAPIHRRLTLAQAVAAFAAFSLFLFGLVKLKERFSKRHQVGHLRHDRPVQQSPERYPAAVVEREELAERGG